MPITHKKITLVALISKSGIQSIQQGYIDTNAPKINLYSNDSTNCIVELTTDLNTAKELEEQVGFITSILGSSWALKFVYDVFLDLRRVKVTSVTSCTSGSLCNDPQVVLSPASKGVSK